MGTMEPSFKKIAALFFLYFLWSFVFSIADFSFSVQAADAVVVDRIVAVVNDDLITLFDLNQTFQPYE